MEASNETVRDRSVRKSSSILPYVKPSGVLPDSHNLRKISVVDRLVDHRRSCESGVAQRVNLRLVERASARRICETGAQLHVISYAAGRRQDAIPDPTVESGRCGRGKDEFAFVGICSTQAKCHSFFQVEHDISHELPLLI